MVPSAVRTFGVEEEFVLVDARTLRASAVGPAVVASAGSDGRGRLEAEMKQEQIEVVSPPHATYAALLDDLRLGRHLADTAAQRHGARVVATGTSPAPLTPTLASGDRYARMAERYGIVAREQFTCGLHVHVSIESAEEGAAVLDRIRCWLPLLLALSTNSPMCHGVETGYQSYRYQTWGRWPTSGPSDIFGDHARYRAIVDGLVASGAVLDEGMIYFDARLSRNHPTVEIRIADVPLYADDAALLAILARALVETAAFEWRSGKQAPPIPTAVLVGAAWTASKEGVTGSLLEPQTGRLAPAPYVLEALIDHVGSALALSGDSAIAADGVARILSRGTGAQRQLDVWKRTNRTDDVIADAALATVDGGIGRGDLRPGAPAHEARVGAG
jgi:carboxylate-amine ligase